MSKDEIPKTVTLDFSKLPEDMRYFHVNTAAKENISLEDELIKFIKAYTEKEQEQGRRAFRERAKATQERWKAIGVSMSIPWVREQFDDEGEDEF